MNRCSITIQYDGELKEVTAGHRELREERLGSVWGWHRDGFNEEISETKGYAKERGFLGK